MNFKEMKTWNPASRLLWKEIVARWGEEAYLEDTQRAEKMAVLKAEWNAAQYARTRATAYPSLTEQLDMQYHDNINGTTTWADAIQAVKDKYPKPQEVGGV